MQLVENYEGKIDWSIASVQEKVIEAERTTFPISNLTRAHS